MRGRHSPRPPPPPRAPPARGPAPPRRRVDLDPEAVHEAVPRQMVEALVREVTATRQRVDSLFYLVVAAVIGEILSRIV